MVLGAWSRKDTLYGATATASIGNGDLAEQLDAGHRAGCPRFAPVQAIRRQASPATRLHAAAAGAAHRRGQFLRRRRPQVIRQVEDGQAVPVIYGGTALKADGTMTGKRLAALVGLRDHARRVLQSQNEGWPESQPRTTPAANSTAPTTCSSAAYGPINKTTFSETADGSVIRRMPNLVKFREDPDAMLVMSLEDYDEVTGKAAKAADHAQGRGRQDARPSPPSHRAEEGLLVSLDQQRRGRPALSSPRSTASPRTQVIAELGDLIYRDPESQSMADRRRLSVRQRAGQARRRRGRRPGLRPQRRGPAGGAAGGRAARRHRRQSRRPVDTGSRHPGVRRRAVRRRRRRRSRSAT